MYPSDAPNCARNGRDAYLFDSDALKATGIPIEKRTS